MKRSLPALVLLLALAGCGSGGHPPRPSPPVAATGSPAGLPRPDHVVIVIFENKAYEQIAGNAAAPYLNGLAARAAVFTDAHAVTHPSQPNYLALFSGSTHGVTDDSCPVRLTGQPSLARQLLDAGLSFGGYSEDLPAAGYRGCSQGGYAAKHNPWADFDNVPAAANQPLTALPGDHARLPTVSVIVPNTCNDMHDCSVSTGDGWGRAHLDGYLRWADSHNSLLLVTFDEDDDGPANHIFTVAAGPMVRPGSYPEPVDHFRLLRTVEALYGLAPLGQAARTTPVTDVWW